MVVKVLKNIGFCLVLGLLCQPTIGVAEACTYNEAKLALERGNFKRAEALMKMAANDGDGRALAYLQTKIIATKTKFDHKQKESIALLSY